MSAVRVLVEPDLRDAVGLGSEELETIEAVYPILSAGAASMPPIMRLDVPENNGEIDIKSAYLPGYPGIAVKVSAGFFDNPSHGLPSLGGLVMVFEADTGVPSAIIFDNGYLTDLRTALAGAVAARHLSRGDSHSAGVVGAGVQARFQLRAMTLVRDISEARIWARHGQRAAEYATEMSEELGIPVRVMDSVVDVIGGSDIVVTATPASVPLIHDDMLHPGLHITAVGSDAEHKQELSAGVVSAADRFICDSIDQSMRLGELRSASAAGFDPNRAIELGAVISGEEVGRADDAEVTICDLTGTGAQDTAIASLAVDRCVGAGVGSTFETRPR